MLAGTLGFALVTFLLLIAASIGMWTRSRAQVSTWERDPPIDSVWTHSGSTYRVRVLDGRVSLWDVAEGPDSRQSMRPEDFAIMARAKSWRMMS